MKDDKKFWISIGITASLQIVFGGSFFAGLTYFREGVPKPLYDTLLIVISVFFIVTLSGFVLIFFRLAFGDWFTKLQQWIKERNERRRNKKRVSYWHDKFYRLSGLIRDVVNNDWQATEAQKENYDELHLWFKINRSKFLPSWHLFQTWRTKPANVRTSLSHSDLEYVVFHEYYKDPFSVFYEPMSLGLLEYSLRNSDKNKIHYVLQKLCELTTEFVAWSLSREY